MARPEKVNPGGEIKRLAVMVPAPVAEKLKKQARKRGVPVAEIVREIILEKVA